MTDWTLRSWVRELSLSLSLAFPLCVWGGQIGHVCSNSHCLVQRFSCQSEASENEMPPPQLGDIWACRSLSARRKNELLVLHCSFFILIWHSAEGSDSNDQLVRMCFDAEQWNQDGRDSYREHDTNHILPGKGLKNEKCPNRWAVRYISIELCFVAYFFKVEPVLNEVILWLCPPLCNYSQIEHSQVHPIIWEPNHIMWQMMGLDLSSTQLSCRSCWKQENLLFWKGLRSRWFAFKLFPEHQNDDSFRTNCWRTFECPQVS